MPLLCSGSAGLRQRQASVAQRARGGYSRVTRGSCPALSPALPLSQEDPSSKRQSCAFGASRAEQEEGKVCLEEIPGRNYRRSGREAQGEGKAAAAALAAARGWSRQGCRCRRLLGRARAGGRSGGLSGR